MICLLLLIWLLPASCLAEEITVTVLNPGEAAQIIPQPTDGIADIGRESDELLNQLEDAGIELQYPELNVYDKRLDELPKMYIQAGSDFTASMQYRAGDAPVAFPGGYWPIAELRTAKSPSGTVLGTYTITVDDVDMVKWSLKLSAAQTAALSGKKGITEMSLPYGDGTYYIFVRIPTEVLPRVSE